MVSIWFILPLVIPTAMRDTPPATATAVAATTPRIVRTIEMDPETPLDIEGWWSDGTRLLEVRRGGDFRIWSTFDRFRPPADVGRWHRENHAVFWLESYRIPKEPRRRVPLWLRDGSLMATLDADEPPFSKMLVPPSVPAESLIGDWACGDHRLAFSADLRWRHRLGDVEDAEPVRRDVEVGSWWMPLDGSLRMWSATSQRPPISGLRRDEQGVLIGLESPFGVFERVQPPAKIEGANPSGAEDEAVEAEDRSPIPRRTPS